MLDAMAQRYHKTPTEIWRDCDALDYVVMTTAQSWEAAQHERANRKPGEVPESARNIPQATLEAMLHKARSK
jgi:hypothetical protein